MQEEMKTSLAALGKEDWPMITNQELEYINELLELLSPMESTTVIMSSEKQITFFLVIVITNGLRDLYTELMKNNKYSELSKIYIK